MIRKFGEFSLKKWDKFLDILANLGVVFFATGIIEGAFKGFKWTNFVIIISGVVLMAISVEGREE